MGGLVGDHRGAIRASYTTAAIGRQGGNSLTMGGMAGAVSTVGSVATSYAAGEVSAAGSHTLGGLFGNHHNSNANSLVNTYWDTTASTRNNYRGGGASSLSLSGHTTTALQTPTDYTGIYAEWNLDLTGDLYPDDIWDFGTTTTYPTLKRPAQWAPTPAYVDYDTDDNGLIEVGSLAQLDAIRHDLDGNGAPASTTAYEAGFPTPTRVAAGRMGCPDGQCRGYELTASLTFPASGDFANWEPIGVHGGASFSAVFDGRGNTLTDLKIDRSGGSVVHAGLFRQVVSGGVIRNLGLLNPAVTSTPGTGSDDHAGSTGALVGYLDTGARIETSYVSGGRIRAAGGESVRVGGLAGTVTGVIIASYATATIAPETLETSVHAGGLAGIVSDATANITASYAAGPIVGTPDPSAEFAGLAGAVYSGATVIASYCDDQVSTRSSCVGDTGSGNVAAGTVEATPTNTAGLQAPTGYSGIYADWNVDTDGDFDPDYPWNFGTASQYPTLNTPAQRLALKPPRVDYDVNDNGLIDVGSIAQLGAIRYDLNGNGDANTAAYAAAFPDRHTAAATRMGCPGGVCAGYELTADLAFGATSTWTPIGGTFTATFDGNGHTLSNLRVNVSSGHAGLFRELGGGTIRDVGLINPAVTSTASGQNTGALVGRTGGGSNVITSYVLGGRVVMGATTTFVGGLVGYHGGAIRASYSTARVVLDGARTNSYIGGLVGWVRSGSIATSYAAGPVTGTGSGSNTFFSGLVGYVSHGGSIADSYCDSQATTRTQANCVGSSFNPGTLAATSTNTAALQTPTDYAGIYAAWNVDLDGDSAADAPLGFRRQQRISRPALPGAAPGDRPRRQRL